MSSKAKAARAAERRPAARGKNRRSERDVVAILVAGGPAPGINGVIAAATIEAINEGYRVLGILDGFRWLARGETTQVRELTIEDVSRIHFHGGSIIGISRVNPMSSEENMQRVIRSLEEMKVRLLVTIGGDDTAWIASELCRRMMGRLRIAHVPKTIDNDLPLPGSDSTFGFQTARHEGVRLIQSLMEDARTTSRWYFITSMGRKAGHLALGIGKAAGVTRVIIAEEFTGEKISLIHLCDIVEATVIKRRAMGREDGLIILAEGLVEKLEEKELKDLRHVEQDAFGHIRLAEVDLGKVVKAEVRNRFKERGIDITIVDKDIGYELRCAPPIPFDCEYTRNLGFGAIRFLRSGGSGAMISYQAGKLVPIYLEDILDPATGKTRVRLVNVRTESYQVALKYMIRLTPEDFASPAQLRRLAQAANMDVRAFRKKFAYLVEEPK